MPGDGVVVTRTDTLDGSEEIIVQIAGETPRVRPELRREGTFDRLKGFLRGKIISPRSSQPPTPGTLSPNYSPTGSKSPAGAKSPTLGSGATSPRLAPPPGAPSLHPPTPGPPGTQRRAQPSPRLPPPPGSPPLSPRSSTPPGARLSTPPGARSPQFPSPRTGRTQVVSVLDTECTPRSLESPEAARAIFRSSSFTSLPSSSPERRLSVTTPTNDVSLVSIEFPPPRPGNLARLASAGNSFKDSFRKAFGGGASRRGSDAQPLAAAAVGAGVGFHSAVVELEREAHQGAGPSAAGSSGGRGALKSGRSGSGKRLSFKNSFKNSFRRSFGSSGGQKTLERKPTVQSLQHLWANERTPRVEAPKAAATKAGAPQKSSKASKAGLVAAVSPKGLGKGAANKGGAAQGAANGKKGKLVPMLKLPAAAVGAASLGVVTELPRSGAAPATPPGAKTILATPTTPRSSAGQVRSNANLPPPGLVRHKSSPVLSPNALKRHKSSPAIAATGPPKRERPAGVSFAPSPTDRGPGAGSGDGGMPDGTRSDGDVGVTPRMPRKVRIGGAVSFKLDEDGQKPKPVAGARRPSRTPQLPAPLVPELDKIPLKRRAFSERCLPTLSIPGTESDPGTQSEPVAHTPHEKFPPKHLAAMLQCHGMLMNDLGHAKGYNREEPYFLGMYVPRWVPSMVAGIYYFAGLILMGLLHLFAVIVYLHEYFGHIVLGRMLVGTLKGPYKVDVKFAASLNSDFQGVVSFPDVDPNTLGKALGADGRDAWASLAGNLPEFMLVLLFVAIAFTFGARRANLRGVFLGMATCTYILNLRYAVSGVSASTAKDGNDFADFKKHCYPGNKAQQQVVASAVAAVFALAAPCLGALLYLLQMSRVRYFVTELVCLHNALRISVNDVCRANNRSWIHQFNYITPGTPRLLRSVPSEPAMRIAPLLDEFADSIQRTREFLKLIETSLGPQDTPRFISAKLSALGLTTPRGNRTPSSRRFSFSSEKAERRFSVTSARRQSFSTEKAERRFSVTSARRQSFSSEQAERRFSTATTLSAAESDALRGMIDPGNGGNLSGRDLAGRTFKGPKLERKVRSLGCVVFEDMLRLRRSVKKRRKAKQIVEASKKELMTLGHAVPSVKLERMTYIITRCLLVAEVVLTTIALILWLLCGADQSFAQPALAFACLLYIAAIAMVANDAVGMYLYYKHIHLPDWMSAVVLRKREKGLDTYPEKRFKALRAVQLVLILLAQVGVWAYWQASLVFVFITAVVVFLSRYVRMRVEMGLVGVTDDPEPRLRKKYRWLRRQLGIVAPWRQSVMHIVDQDEEPDEV